MVEVCVRCGIGSDEVRIFDAIYEGRMEFICERCAIIENVPIVKKPEASQLKEAEAGDAVFDRMKRISGIKEVKEEEVFFREDKLKELDENPELELPEGDKLDLIEHYHWEIMKNRRRKGLSQQQLAENLGESEVAIQMIEKGKLPENAEVLVRKLEQFFQIRLRKVSEIEKITKEREKEEVVLLGEDGRELDVIPEPEIEKKVEPEIEDIKDEDIFEDKEITSSTKTNHIEPEIEVIDVEKDKDEDIEKDKERVEAIEDFDIKKADWSKVKIADLKEMHRRKIEATKQEQIEEQKKIEERRRILEALRERDRLKHEEEQRRKEIERQKAEQERQRIIDERKEKLRLRREKESQELDKELGGIELLKNEKKENFKDFNEFGEELV